MGSSRARRFAAAAVAALLLASVTAVLVASAAPGTRAAARPAGARQMNYSCAFDLYNAKKVLHFATRPSSCRGSGRKLINYKKQYPVYACRKEHGGFAARQKRFQFPNGIYGHGPAGLMRYVDSPSQCAPRSQPNETPVTLPSTKVWRLFCAAKRGAELRWVNDRTSCNSREFLVGLPPITGFPVARADNGSTDEDHGTTVNVLANDRNTSTSNSNSGLQIASTDTTGTKGNITVNPDGTIGYNPNGQFESLKVGQTGTDRFSYRVKRGTRTSAPATVTITVNGVNDLPVANNDSASTDSAHTKSIPVLSNDTDADGDSLSVSVDTAGTQGNVTVNGDGTVTYDPNHKFDSLGPSDTAHDTFKYKANDGHGDSNVASVDVTIGGVDDPPVVTTSPGALAYTEGDPATVLDAGVTVSDPDSANLQSARIAISDGHNINDVLHLPNPPDDPVAPAPGGITAFYDANAGVLSLTAPAGGASKADWQAALRQVTFQSSSDNPFPTKKLDFTVNDGNSDSAISTKTITTTNINDAPQVQTTGGTADFTEDSPPVAVDPSIDVSDPDSLQLQSATLAITQNFSSADGDTLAMTPNPQNGISASYNATTGVLTLTGLAGVSDYQSAIQSVTFSNSSNTPSTADRTVSITVKDAEGADSNTDTRAVTVTAHNDAPTATDQSGLTTNEDTSLPVTVAGTDPEGDSLTFTHDSASAHGGTITGIGSSLTYAPAADYCGSDSFNFQADDGNGGTDTGTVSITVTCVNDAPVVTTSSGSASFTEDSPAVQVDPGVTAGDVDNANQASATVSITTNFSSTDGDTLAMTPNPQNGISASYDSSTGVLTLTGSSSVANYQAALRSITFSNTSNTPSTATRTVSFKVNDGAVDSNSATRDVTVAAHNDAPTATDQNVSTNEDTPKGITLAGTDPESDPLTFGHDTTSANGGTISGSGSSVTYTPAQDYCNNPPGSSPDTFNFTVDDGNGGTDTGTVSITVDCVNDAPAVTTSSGSASFTEDSPAVAVDPGITVSDVDNANQASATVSITTNFSSTDGDTLAMTPNPQNGISASYDSSTGVLTLTGSSSVANYQAALRSITFSNSSNTPSTATRTVSFKVNDGAVDSNSATRDVTVAAHNDAPTATDQSGLTTNEDTSLPITLAGTDPDGDSLTFSADSVSANGGSITGVGASVTYAPAQDYCSATPDTFGFTVDDGHGGTDSGTVSITVTCVNDGPVVDLNGGGAGTSSTATFEEATLTPAQLAPSGTVNDVDSTQLTSLTVTLTNPQAGDTETLAASAAGTGLTVHSYDSGTGILLIDGTGSLSDYQSVLQTVTYSNSTHPPNPTSRTVTFIAHDADGADGPSSTATVTVLPIDAPPIVDLNGAGAGIDNNASFTEGTAVAIAPSADVTDTDDTDLESATVTLTNRPDGNAESLSRTGILPAGITIDPYDSSTGELRIHGHTTLSNYQDILRGVKYNNTSDTPNTATRDVTVTVNDGQLDNTPTPTSHVSVTPVNDAPTLDLNGAPAGVNTTADFFEDQPAVTIAPSATVGDVDDTNLESGTITLTNHPDGAAESLSVDTTGTSIVASGNGTHAITLSGSHTLADYQQVLQTIKYNNTSQNADTTDRVVTFVVNDGTDDSNSPSGTVTIHVTNDPPVVDMNGGGGGIDSSAAFTEDSSPTVVGSGPVNLGSSATVSDVDNSSLTSATLTITNHSAGDVLSVNLSGTPITTGGYNSTTGELQLTGNGATPAQFQSVIQSAQYNNTSNTPDPTSRDVTTKVNDGTADSTVAHTTVSVTPTNDAPTLTGDSFTGTNGAVGNTTFVGNGPNDGTPSTPDPTDTSAATNRPHKTITADIKSNDSDPEGNTFTVTSAGTAADPTNGQTQDGGTVTVTSGGDFVVEPKASTSCTDHSDSFTYKVTDNGSPAASSTATVSFDIAGCVWYVNNNDAQGNSGTSAAPYDSLSSAETNSSAGDTIFVYHGDGSSTGQTTGIDLKANQKLVGEADTLSVGTDTLQSGGGGTKRPTIKDTASNVVNLAAGNTVTGVQVDPEGGGGISGGAGDTSGTIADVKITDTGTAGTGPGLDLNGTGSGSTYNVSDLTIDNTGATTPPNTETGVRLLNAGTVNFASAGNISVKTKVAGALDASNGAGTTSFGAGSVFDDVVVQSTSSVRGISLSGTTGTVSIGDDVTSDITASGAAAVDVSGSSNVGLHLHNVSSSGGTNGINFDNNGTSTFDAQGNSGSVSGSANDVRVNAGSGDFNYPGTLANGTGNTATISNRTGGTNAFGGAINDDSDAGGGISITGNSAGSTFFSGTTKTLNTGASDAISISQPDGGTHAVTFPNGGLNIDTSTGTGLAASGVGGTPDGSLNVDSTGGTGNVIDTTTTGTGVSIQNAAIGGTGLTFEHVSTNTSNGASGPTNGILLSNSGTGNFIVSGTGSATCNSSASCTGGAILKSSGPGIQMTSVAGAVSLTRMFVNGGGDDGIRATTVGTSGGNGIALSNDFVSNNGNAVNENGLEYDNVLGISSINNTTATGNAEFNARIDNDNGVGRFTVSSSTFSSNSVADGADGLLLNGDGTAQMRALVQNSSFSANADDGFQLLANADSSMDLQFNNNTVNTAGNAGAASAHSALNFDGNTTSDVRMSMTGGSVTTAGDTQAGSAIIVNPIGNSSTAAAADSASFAATFDNVTIGTAGVPGSGATTGQGFRVIPAENVDDQIVIKNSHINGTAQFGALLRHNDGGGHSDFTFTGNTIRNVGSGNEPIFVQSGSLNTDANDVCADIGGTGGDNTNPPGNDFAGQASGGVTDIAFRRPSAAASAHLKLPGFTPPASTNLQPYIQGRNVGNPTALNFSGELEAGPAACQQPTLPTAP